MTNQLDPALFPPPLYPPISTTSGTGTISTTPPHLREAEEALADTTKSMAKSVATYYNQLIADGVSEQSAVQLVLAFFIKAFVDN